MSADKKLNKIEKEVVREVNRAAQNNRSSKGGPSRILAPVIAVVIIAALLTGGKIGGFFDSDETPRQQGQIIDIDQGQSERPQSNQGSGSNSGTYNDLEQPAGFDLNSLLNDCFDEYDYETLPEYNGDGVIELNGNIPDFADNQITDESFEFYSDLDDLGRCGPAVASLSFDTMPEAGERRESIREVRPTGWHQNMYDFVDQEALYNRSHLIAWSLSAENANEQNLITGTRYMNDECMRPYEESVVAYIRNTGNHVMYRVTPVFVDDELVARGVVVEAYSVEDLGDGICFNIFIYNVQPGVIIDYETGYNQAA